MRSPATLSIMRHTLIRANGEPLELIGDQRHHQQTLAAQLATPPYETLAAEHRRKLHDEIARSNNVAVGAASTTVQCGASRVGSRGKPSSTSVAVGNEQSRSRSEPQGGAL